jgi:hypothetical protein
MFMYINRGNTKNKSQKYSKRSACNMAKLLTAIGIKFVATLVLLYVILGAIGGLSFGSVLLITVVLGLVSYMVGDMLILAKTNNMTATMADLGLAFVLIWLMAASFTDGGIVGTARPSVGLSSRTSRNCGSSTPRPSRACIPEDASGRPSRELTTMRLCSSPRVARSGCSHGRTLPAATSSSSAFTVSGR